MAVLKEFPEGNPGEAALSEAVADDIAALVALGKPTPSADVRPRVSQRPAPIRWDQGCLPLWASQVAAGASAIVLSATLTHWLLDSLQHCRYRVSDCCDLVCIRTTPLISSLAECCRLGWSTGAAPLL